MKRLSIILFFSFLSAITHQSCLAQDTSDRDSIEASYAKAVGLINAGAIESGEIIIQELVKELPTNTSFDSLRMSMHVRLANLLYTRDNEAGLNQIYNLIGQYKRRPDAYNTAIKLFLYHSLYNKLRDSDPSKADSLRDVLVDIAKNETSHHRTRANLFYELALNGYHKNDMISFRKFTDLALEFCGDDTKIPREVEFKILELPTFDRRDDLSAFEIGQRYSRIVEFGRKHKLPEFATGMTRVCLNTGNFYWQQYDDDRAYAYFQEGLKWAGDKLPVEKYLKYLIQSSMHRCMANQGLESEAISKSNTLLENNLEGIPVYGSNLMMSVHFHRMQIFSKAKDKEQLRESTRLFMKALKDVYGDQSTHPHVLQSYSNAATYAEAVGDFELAYQYGILENPNFDLSQAHQLNPKAIGTTLFKMGKYQMVDSLLTNLFDAIHAEIEAPVNYLNFIKDVDAFYHILSHLPSDHAFVKRGLDLVSHHYDLIIDLSMTPTNYVDSESEVIVKALNDNVLNFLKKCDFDIQEVYFKILENIRYVELTVEKETNTYWESTGVPAKVVSQRYVLIQEINELRSKFLSSYDTTRDSLSLSMAALQDSLTNLEDQFRIQHRLTNETQSNPSIELNDLKANLAAKDLVLLFFSGNEYIYVQSITNTTAKIHSVPVEETEALFNAAIDHLTEREPMSENTLKDIYTTLVSPSLEGLPEELNIHLVPDGLLHNLPIDLLPISDDEMIIHRHATSYYVSTQQIIDKKNRDQQGSKKSTIAAFAPSFVTGEPTINQEQPLMAMRVSSELIELPNAANEATFISEIWNGKKFINEEGSKEMFLAEAPQYDILHLALHAVFDEKDHLNSALHFGNDPDDRLSFGEISNRYLDTEMITLSACNTGTGIHQNRANIRSLARGFLSAGAKSVIMSHWKVSDHSTAQIMKSFYSELKKGVTKDQALRKAKLAYLEDNQDSTLEHPFYWAGFAVFGDTHALTPKGSGIGWQVALSIGILILLGFIRVKRKSRA